MPAIIGVDIGGTFADFVAIDRDTGRIETLKVLTTPDAPGRDIGSGLKRLAESGLDLPSVDRFVHGTTVGVNTIIQRCGARVALICTDGFTDILELARLRMPNPYSLFCERPAPLVAREHVFGVRERMTASGETLVEPSADDVARALEGAKRAGCEVVVVSFLHAWREPRHERAVARMIRERRPDLTVFCGSEVWPVIREYERTTIAVLNAYVQPRIDTYIRRVAGELEQAGIAAPLLLTTSIGGTMTAEAGRRDCVGMLLSGTASGVVGASIVAKAAGVKSVLTLDIGGTSADVALLENGEPSFSTGLSIGEFPLATTTVAVVSSGQGGGSVVWIDGEGVMQVGPRSAGSTPGPACFGRGGSELTVTDAALLTGILGHARIGFGAISPQREASEAAAQPIADRLGIEVAQLAEGALQVAVSGMLIAIEQLLARAGVHASELTLMPFGGAGPMLGALLAEAAGMRRLLVPAVPGTLCALGAASAPIRRDTMRTVLLPLDEDTLPILRGIIAALEEEADGALEAMAGPGPSLALHAADLRYRGQSFEIMVPLDGDETVDSLRAAFHEAHERNFGHADLEAPIQVVNVRATSARPAPDIALPHEAMRPHAAEPVGEGPLFQGGAWVSARLFERDGLGPGARLDGPAIVMQNDTTLLVPPGWSAVVDEFRNIEMERA
ncbi:hydantoinase/oxoprolinase family protein [uncultured Aureimonas sp.]|uniref:hydantoinase/oxoprolinase family protein n=1 Tax=uncultured Aureimonas sp. TaxID=1604662 RepID=UPI0025DD96E8|nr:hydantoinase/oxoprolinase family protein [uncultured Aureimonas sp.]